MPAMTVAAYPSCWARSRGGVVSARKHRAAFRESLLKRDVVLRCGLYIGTRTPTPPGRNGMTQNKRTVTEYLEGFRRSDHARILSCLSEDVEWEIPGMFH